MSDNEYASLIERRPDAANRNTTIWPPEWGDPPAGRAQRASWIKVNIQRGIERRSAGEQVPWLAEEGNTDAAA